jgi:tetratricopeptide (TPR) repeat protein
VWTASDRERARAAFVATALPYADAAWTRTERVVDDRIDAWAAASQERCESGTRARSCDERTRAQLVQTIGVLADADATTVTQAGTLVDGLASDDCREPTRVSSIDPFQHAALVADLAFAQAQKRAGHTVAARTDLEDVVDRARDLGDEAVRREAELELAAMLPGFGEEEVAVAMLADLAYGALASGDDAVALEALTALLMIDGGQRSRFDAAQRWDRDATAILARVDAPARARSRLERARGSMQLNLGDFAAATESFRGVLAFVEATHGPEAPATANALRDLGLALFQADRLEEARECLERSLVIRERELGPEHPDYAASLDLLFAIERGRGEYARSLELAVGALAIYERTRGLDHLDTINARMHVGMALEYSDLPAARDAMAMAVESLARTLGSDHNQTTNARFNLVQIELQLQQYDDALANAHRVHDVWRRLHGDDHVMTIASTIAIGTALLSLDRLDDARPWFTDAIARSRDGAPARLAAAHDALANLESAAGDHARAGDLYAAAAAGWSTAYGAEHPEARASRERVDRMRELAAARRR